MCYYFKAGCLQAPRFAARKIIISVIGDQPMNALRRLGHLAFNLLVLLIPTDKMPVCRDTHIRMCVHNPMYVVHPVCVCIVLFYAALTIMHDA